MTVVSKSGFRKCLVIILRSWRPPVMVCRQGDVLAKRRFGASSLTYACGWENIFGDSLEHTGWAPMDGVACGTLACIGTRSGMSSRLMIGRFHSTSSVILITTWATLHGRAMGSRVQKRLGTVITGVYSMPRWVYNLCTIPTWKTCEEGGWRTDDPLWTVECPVKTASTDIPT